MTNKCRKTFDECTYGYNLFIGKKVRLATDVTLTKIPIHSIDRDRYLLGEIKTERRLKLVVEGVGMSEVENSKINYGKGTDSIFSNFLAVPVAELKPIDFIRSTIIRVKGLAKLEVNNPDSFISILLQFDLPGPLDLTHTYKFEVV